MMLVVIKQIKVIYKNEHQMSPPAKEAQFFQHHLNIRTHFLKLAA